MNVAALGEKHLADAAGLFVERYAAQRAAVPILPDTMLDPDNVASRLRGMVDAGDGIAAMEGGRLAGYLAWFTVDDMRDTGRKAAYCPEWAHAVADRELTVAYPLMYRIASERWTASGCRTHAISLLANDAAAREAWFWSGFGMGTVDAVRSMAPLPGSRTTEAVVRKAGMDDLEALCAIEEEHCRHYEGAPVFMAPRSPRDAGEIRFLIDEPGNSVWLAAEGMELSGFMTIESGSFGAADIVAVDDTIAITGAFVRPDRRGKGIASALLDAALNDYRDRGVARCSVDFEGFNPEASAFWLRTFDPVCLSLMRMPESLLDAG